MLHKYYIGLVVVLAPVIVSGQQEVVEETQYGRVKGKIGAADPSNPSGPQVRRYLSIPFAKPPLNELRFKPPQPPAAWENVWDSESNPNSCPQNVAVAGESSFLQFLSSGQTETNEDCLYLSVVTPDPKPVRAPVMIWIHGGGYTTGSYTSDLYEPGVLASTNGLVIVSLHYRLGALGFLSLGIEEAPGNVGLLDQQFGMKWVKENIESFGGDPDRITLFGESAGAGSVSFQLLAPDSHQYFSRGIMQSGVATAEWSMEQPDVARRNALELARQLGCPHDASGDMRAVVTCLRGVEHTKMVNTTIQIKPSDADPNFLKGRHAADIIRSKSFYKAPILLGTNQHEGDLFLPFFAPLLYSCNVSKPEVNDSQPLEDLLDFQMTTMLFNDIQKGAVAFQYTDWTTPDITTALSDINTDPWFFCPAQSFAKDYVEAEQTVFYYLMKEEFTRDNGKLCPWMRSFHIIDVFFVFGRLLTQNYADLATAENRDLSLLVMNYWSNFAETGNPNQGSHNVGSNSWPDYSDKMEYVELVSGVTPLPVEQGPSRTRYCALWDHYLAGLQHAKIVDGTEEVGGGARHVVSLPILALALLATSFYYLLGLRLGC